MAPDEDKDAVKKLMSWTQKFRKDKGYLFYTPISLQQAITTADQPATGPVWASRTILPAPKDDCIITAITEAIYDLDDGSCADLVATLADVQVQWSGFRSGVGRHEKEPTISEEDKYKGLMKDTRSKTTIIYAHGGLNYSGGPASVRAVTSTLAKLTKGRCLVLEQRLAPQDPFPAPLIDLLVAYLSLLYPPEDAFHEATTPENIVIAGESSGGNLCLSFLLLLQHFQQRKTRINFHGNCVSIPYPAGFATFCAQGDATMSFPSYARNKNYDIIDDVHPTLSDIITPDSIWPSTPPRSHIYSPTTNLITHPLVSPVSSKSWPSIKPPPMFFAYGQERMLDEGRFMAKQAFKAGASVQLHQYNALPHIFAFIAQIPQTAHLFTQWAQFCRMCVEEPQKIDSSRYYIHEPVAGPPGFKTIPRDVGDGKEFTDLEYEEVLKLMDGNKKKMKVWNGPKTKSSL
ncbi:putative lipase esterase protein [Botrytis fragariae]|uniref:Putative lipase esterase protein n=1 Tax=Botrytis fragariae TaxID=1964551 RepID=A0A8H6B2H6_9HELO|nr:putative lipase esterase protein [Botrytis fragariae]KAF5877910.1 putative lipase esterase protein [Botrytis fragariae]